MGKSFLFTLRSTIFKMKINGEPAKHAACLLCQVKRVSSATRRLD